MNNDGIISAAKHLTAFVSYQLPSYEELNGTAFDQAIDSFGRAYTWRHHESVRGRVDPTPGNRDFLVKHFNKKIMSEEEDVIAWADANGYRVATLEEAVDFAKAHPGLQLEFPIVVLGSFTMRRGFHCITKLCRGVKGRLLTHGWYTCGWTEEHRFLLVRKTA